MKGNKKIKTASLTIIILFTILIISVIVNFSQARQLNKQNIEKDSLQEKLIKVHSELGKKTSQLNLSKKQKDSKQSLLSRCGNFPDEVPRPSSLGHYTVLSGPEWSTDCRYIAWGIWESGTSWLGEVKPEETLSPASRPLATEGIFLYNDCNKKIQKIYIPRKMENPETPEFVGWKDSKTIILHTEGRKINKYLDIDTMEVAEE